MLELEDDILCVSLPQDKTQVELVVQTKEVRKLKEKFFGKK